MLDAIQAAQLRSLPDMTWEERRDLGLFRILRALPVPVVSRIGAVLGQLLGRRGHPATAARVAASLPRLLPDLVRDSCALESAQRRLWANVGRVFAEFCVVDRIVSEGRVSIRDSSALEPVLADGRSIIMAYVHLGNWEAIGMHLSRHIPDRMCAFALTPANRVQAQIAAMQRTRFPGKVFAVDAMAWRHAIEHLKHPGGILYLSVDEDNESGISFPSFGRRLDMHGNLGKIVRVAARTGAVILPMYCERLPGPRFCVHFLEPVEFDTHTAFDPQEILRRMQHLDALFTPIVLRLIDQWFGLLEFRP